MQNLNSNLFGTFTCMILLLSGNMLLFNYILANLKKKKKVKKFTSERDIIISFSLIIMVASEISTGNNI